VELPPDTIPTIVQVHPQPQVTAASTPTSICHGSSAYIHNQGLPDGSGLMGFGKFSDLTRETVYTEKYFYVEWTKKTVKKPRCANMLKWIQFIRHTELCTTQTSPANSFASTAVSVSPVTPARKIAGVYGASSIGCFAVM
jgi:hypothetical protein